MYDQKGLAQLATVFEMISEQEYLAGRILSWDGIKVPQYGPRMPLEYISLETEFSTPPIDDAFRRFELNTGLFVPFLREYITPATASLAISDTKNSRSITGYSYPAQSEVNLHMQLLEAYTANSGLHISYELKYELIRNIVRACNRKKAKRTLQDLLAFLEIQNHFIMKLIEANPDQWAVEYIDT